MEHLSYFGDVFKMDLTKETRTQLQEEEAIASSCLVLAMPWCQLKDQHQYSPESEAVVN